jgi:hypothetical protein
MVHYYCFIEDATCIQPDTKIFKVKIGSSSRDQIKRQLLDCYSIDTGAFFRVWDADTDYFLGHVATAKPVDLHTQNFGLSVVVTDIHTLYRNIINGTLSALVNPPHVTRNAFRMMSILSPTFFHRNRPKGTKPSVPPVKRQNLSVRPTREDTIAAVGFALMAILYWLGSLVCGLEKVWL